MFKTEAVVAQTSKDTIQDQNIRQLSTVGQSSKSESSSENYGTTKSMIYKTKTEAEQFQKKLKESWQKTILAYNKAKYEEALEGVAYCLSMDSMQVSYWFLKAEALRKANSKKILKGKDSAPNWRDESIKAYKKVISINPRVTQCYNAMFTLEAQNGNLSEAKNYLRKGAKMETHKSTKEFFIRKILIINYLDLFRIL